MPLFHENIELLNALEARRSMARLTEDRPPRELVQRVLAAAAWAPNHFKTEPWRFAVVAGEARNELGAVMERSFRENRASPPPGAEAGEFEAAAAKERNKPLRAPVIIAIACVPSEDPKVSVIEEHAAVAAAVQNMLLAAEALGLGAMWRTGKPAYDARVKHYLGFPAAADILAFMYLGYPDLPPQRPRSRSIDRHVEWLGWY